MGEAVFILPELLKVIIGRNRCKLLPPSAWLSLRGGFLQDISFFAFVESEGSLKWSEAQASKCQLTSTSPPGKGKESHPEYLWILRACGFVFRWLSS